MFNDQDVKTNIVVFKIDKCEMLIIFKIHTEDKFSTARQTKTFLRK